MGIFWIFGETYPVFGFDGGCRAMSADEIVKMQISQQIALQQAVRPPSYLQGLANYQPPQRPLDERFADFKLRLAAAVESRKIGLAFPSQITTNKVCS
jgi:hypothetical protein